MGAPQYGDDKRRAKSDQAYRNGVDVAILHAGKHQTNSVRKNNLL